MIKDSLNRTFRTLRISLTNACNFGCVYCVTGEKEEHVKGKTEALSVQKLAEIVKNITAVTEIDTIRFTGGEPLLYKDLNALVAELSVTGIKMSLTTNGYFLKRKLDALVDAGISSINVSLDAANADVFYKMTRRLNFKEVIEGIDEAIFKGVEVKLNSVIMKGINDDQVIPLLKLAGERKVPVRFLELMSMGHLYENSAKYAFSEKEILEEVKKHARIFPLERKKSATAKYWMTENMVSFGIISNNSDPFCHDCNRLRLDSYGNIYGCLSSDLGIFVKEVTEDVMEEKLRLALSQKKMKFSGSLMSMKSIGG
ncbi:MAG: GTP 3',8-cyclase MoaA [Cytophagaceae bacterium]